MGGPIQLNKDGTFDLELLNQELRDKGLELDIKYFQKDDRYGYMLYRVKDQ